MQTLMDTFHFQFNIILIKHSTFSDLFDKSTYVVFTILYLLGGKVHVAFYVWYNVH